MNIDTKIDPDSGHSPKSASGAWVNRHSGRSTARFRSAGPRGTVPHLLLGVLLVLACAGGFVLVTLHSGDRQPVLALARDVPVGHQLTTQDIRKVRVSLDAEVVVIHADQAATVVGRPMAMSLPGGSLLTPGTIGGDAGLVEGEAIAALALKPGLIPAEVGPGAQVSLVFAPGDSEMRGPVVDDAAAWSAVVTNVTEEPTGGVTVISVKLAETAAREVATVPVGQIAVVMLSTGGR